MDGMLLFARFPAHSLNENRLYLLSPRLVCLGDEFAIAKDFPRFEIEFVLSCPIAVYAACYHAANRLLNVDQCVETLRAVLHHSRGGKVVRDFEVDDSIN